jgi:hypothetical protein
MNQKALLPLLLALGLAAGYIYGVNMWHGEDESSPYSEEMSVEVNATNVDGEVHFDNNSIGIWYNEGEFFLDMDNDNSFESELSDNETASGEFVREVVRGDKAYQIYFHYEKPTNESSASLEVYRVRRI